MILVWSEEEEEGNQVTNVQNVHRWLNKIPPQPNLQRNPGQNSIFSQEERVFAQMASYLSNLDNLSKGLNLFFPASSFYSCSNIFDVNTFQYSLTQALNVVGRYELHQVNLFAIIGPNHHVFKLCFAFSDEKMMMQKCISAAGLFPLFWRFPEKLVELGHGATPQFATNSARVTADINPCSCCALIQMYEKIFTNVNILIHPKNVFKKHP